ncbi:MAG TPA: TorF family putative porin [Sphingomonas sp.]|nr:TorF family putative porin [Sphingomonas sp.]
MLATAPARPARSLRRPVEFLSIWLAAAVLIAAPATPAAAQVTGSLGVQNTYRLRGYSVSGGHPVATLNLYYDHPSGIYVNLSGLGELDHGATPEALGYIANVGYARRIGPQLSIDGGAVRTQFSHYAVGRNAGAHYTDFYVGIAGRGLSSHLHYSPDYYRHGASTLYGEIDGALAPAENWQLTGHVGLLGYLDYPASAPGYRASRQLRYDWRAGIARQLGAFLIHADLSGGGPRGEAAYYRPTARQGTALTIGVTWVF